MKIKELIESLELIEDKEKEIFVFDYADGDNFKIDSISLFDGDSEHSEENMYSINIKGN